MNYLKSEINKEKTLRLFDAIVNFKHKHEDNVVYMFEQDDEPNTVGPTGPPPPVSMPKPPQPPR